MAEVSVPTAVAENLKAVRLQNIPDAVVPTANEHALNGEPTRVTVDVKTIPSYRKSRIALENRHIDEPRALRVAVIGGGLAGILAGILLPAKVPGIQLTIYEKNQDFV